MDGMPAVVGVFPYTVCTCQVWLQHPPSIPSHISDDAPKSTVEKHETDCSLSSSTKVKNAQICSYVTSFPYALMVWCLIKDGHDFIFVYL